MIFLLKISSNNQLFLHSRVEIPKILFEVIPLPIWEDGSGTNMPLWDRIQQRVPINELKKKFI